MEACDTMFDTYLNCVLFCLALIILHWIILIVSGLAGAAIVMLKKDIQELHLTYGIGRVYWMIGVVITFFMGSLCFYWLGWWNMIPTCISAALSYYFVFQFKKENWYRLTFG